LECEGVPGLELGSPDIELAYITTVGCLRIGEEIDV
jgi:hypothetical protein